MVAQYSRVAEITGASPVGAHVDGPLAPRSTCSRVLSGPGSTLPVPTVADVLDQTPPRSQRKSA